MVWTTLPSPFGEMLVVAEGGAITLLHFSPFTVPDGLPSPDDPLLAQARRELAEYFEGTRQVFDLPLDLCTTGEFRRTVQLLLPSVGYGHTVSYTELATLAGRPTAVRAVGTACATNPLPLVVPCHRVLRGDGSLGGYLGGLDAKRTLLDLERRMAA